MNLYRVTLRDQDGEISDHEKKAGSMLLALQDVDEQFAVVKVERISASTGQVLGGFYSE